MISIKKFAMAVMLLAGFQQVFADVCKLKVNNDILRVFEVNPDRCEVWVDVRDGRIYNLEFDNCIHIVKSTVEAFNDDGELKDEYKDAIFVNDNSEVVILNGLANIENILASQYESLLKDKKLLDNDNRKVKERNRNNRRRKQYELNDSDVNISFVKQTLLDKDSETDLINKLELVRGKIRKEAKRQFENIIKCLLTTDKKQINDKIYLHQFTDSKAGWQMPGASAFLEDGENIANVYYAMKTKFTDNGFWTVEDYSFKSIKHFYSHEHTERQLLVNHCYGGRMSRAEPDHERPDLTNALAGGVLINNGSLYFWTKGNPCLSSSLDNGGVCCTSWYELLNNAFAENNVVVNVYFSVFQGNQLQSEHKSKEPRQNCNNLIRILDLINYEATELSGNDKKIYQYCLQRILKNDKPQRPMTYLLKYLDYYDEVYGIRDGQNLNWIIDSLYCQKLIVDKQKQKLKNAFNRCFCTTNITYNII